MATWLEDVIEGLRKLNGVASLKEIYETVGKIRAEPHPRSFEAIIRRTIETYSSDSHAYNGKNDIFYSVDGLGGGVWGLRSLKVYSPLAVDVQISNGVEEPLRVYQETYRIIRDTALAKTLKSLHDHRCQICELRIEISPGKYYSEAHHIKPLGNPHSGPDVAENIIVLCPNHHVMMDYGAIELDVRAVKIHSKHTINNEYVEYHNINIYKEVC